MKIYRVVYYKELDDILGKKTNTLGNFFLETRSNTHKYKRETKYIHFFLNKKASENIKYILKCNQRNLDDYYVCTFSVPIIDLISSVGKGYYYSNDALKNRGYDFQMETRIEFAIDANKFKPEWLIKYEPLTNCSEEEKER
ncbi:MAG: hypothetical protein IJS68_00285 [Clostridia bacterium]|nr:hypothetical protein [Clostridia bacterium]